jgi:hypothetical protein
MKVIIKRMTIMECWCPNCGTGQMESIMADSFKNKKPVESYIDTEIECKNCKEKLQIDDVVNLIPESFLLASVKDINNYKKDNSVGDFLNAT